MLFKLDHTWLSAQLGLIFSAVSESTEVVTPLAYKNDVKQWIIFQLQDIVAAVSHAWPCAHCVTGLYPASLNKLNIVFACTQFS